MPNWPDMVALVGWGGTPHQSTNPLFFQWTHVMCKSRNNADISEEELLKIFNQKGKRAENPVVAPRMYPSRSSLPKINSHSHKKITKDVPKANRKSIVKNPYHVDHVSLANLKLQISKNDAILKKDLVEVKSHIKSIKQSLKRSVDMVLAQKALYLKLTKCAADCLPSSWNQQWLRDCDLLSPSTLPRIPKETVKTKTNHLQLVDSLQQTVEDLKLKMCHISDDIQNWENIMQDNETYLYNPCEDHDVADCYYSGDLSDYSNDKWHPISFVCRPVSKKHKCRKICKRRV
jgi:hypothetical protein